MLPRRLKKYGCALQLRQITPISSLCRCKTLENKQFFLEHMLIKDRNVELYAFCTLKVSTLDEISSAK
jgi:hypothetical protein